MLVVAVDEHYIYCDSQDQVMYEKTLVSKRIGNSIVILVRKWISIRQGVKRFLD